ncbi:MAG TPA: hypothetical protein VL309_02955 [Vicinamibacterales bacterium]|jgi:hypothetical protein|nr:hypothetical protein [Vicinamibacterales bacterium]
MRTLLVACSVFVMLAAAAPSPSAAPLPVASVSAAPVAALQIPDKKIEITIGDHSHAWYRNPVWIAIGILAVVVILLLVALIARGGTTIIKE